MLGVVLLEGGPLDRPHVEGDERVPLGLDAAQDLAGQAALHAVGLDEDEAALGHGVAFRESDVGPDPTDPATAATHPSSRSLTPPTCTCGP
ncbi:hypothetical protein GCM10028814_08940 [Angustibacter aerolatus]